MYLYIFLWVLLMAQMDCRIVRGVSPTHLSQYQTNEFKCFDGKKTIPITSVNDDYCDCEDGSDEPGTPACLNGKYYCLNSGHIPLEITSSRVLDGICDCCDGSDEYDENTKISICSNACEAAAREAQKGLIEEINKHNEGLKKSREMRNMHAKNANEKRASKSTLENEIEILKQRETQLQANKENAQKILDQTKERIKEGILGSLELELDEWVKEEASREAQNIPQPTEGEQAEAEDEEGDEEGDEEEEATGDPLQPPPIPTVPETTKETREQRKEKILKERTDNHEELAPFKDEVTRFESDLASVRKDLRDKENELAETKKFLELDFGHNGEFGSLYNNKVEIQAGEYRYELYPFKEVLQVGGSTHNLGRWTGWGSDDYSIMNYEGGDRCWGGPDRSTTVYVICGVNNRVFDVKEPSKCEYSLVFETPAACTEEKLSELQSQLK